MQWKAHWFICMHSEVGWMLYYQSVVNNIYTMYCDAGQGMRQHTINTVTVHQWFLPYATVKIVPLSILPCYLEGGTNSHEEISMETYCNSMLFGKVCKFALFTPYTRFHSCQTHCSIHRLVFIVKHHKHIWKSQTVLSTIIENEK